MKLAAILLTSLLLAACACNCGGDEKPAATTDNNKHALGDSGVTVSGHVQSGGAATPR